jgi:hypothetical protein
MSGSLPGQDEPREIDPSEQSVRNFLLYSLSLPERAVRGTSGVVGGAIKHSAELLIPKAFHDSRTYTVLVRFTLDFMINDVAGVKDPPAVAAVPLNADGTPAIGDDSPAEAPPVVDQFIARKTVGSFLDLAGMATLHLSPMLVLAVVSDVAYGSRAYLQELSRELKTRGLIDERSTIDGAGDLLDAVAGVSGLSAAALDAPPISVAGLRETIAQTREAAARLDLRKMIPQAEMERMWSEMHEIADEQGLDVMAVSSAMTLHSLGKIGQLGQGALSGVRVAGNLFDRQVLSHYRTALGEIHAKGFYATVSETSAPYIEAVWENFSSTRDTLTEQLLTGRLWNRACGIVRGWFGGEMTAAIEQNPPPVVPATSDLKAVRPGDSATPADSPLQDGD